MYWSSEQSITKWSACLAFWACFLTSCSSNVPLQREASAQKVLQLVPMPRHVQAGQGVFELNAQTVLVVASVNALQAANFLAQSLRKEALLTIQVKQQTTRKHQVILLEIDPAFAAAPEGYSLSVQPNRIICKAASLDGLFWGVQTLRQMILLQLAEQKVAQPVKVSLPAVEIQDAPAFAWRGLMLDVSRHFISKESLKRYIDYLSFYKLNTLHLHLSDDQGWRVAVSKYPKLTEVGAVRQEPDGSKHSGFYTATDIKELVLYAQSRRVNLVPEIDIPGHALAILAAYPELSCTGGPFSISNKAGVHQDILCAGNEKTYQFLADVLAEVASFFPGKYVHTGGDEAPKDRWKACLKCQRRIKELGLADEDALQGYFTKRVTELLQRHNKQAIVWDEVLAGGIDPRTLVQAWHGVDAVKNAVNQGAKVIVSPRSSFYFDLNSGITNVEKVLATPIIPHDLPAVARQQIIGAEAALWTEETPEDKVDGMVFPRLLAFAENVWRSSHDLAYSEFKEGMRHNYSLLENLGVQYGFEDAPVKVKSVYIEAANGFNVELQPGLSNVVLRYTLDGSLPTIQSAQYTGQPIQFTTSGTLKIIPFKVGKAWSEPVEAVFEKHLALHKQPSLSSQFHPTYAAGGIFGLTDGIIGDCDFRKGFWQGYEKHDFEGEIDLGTEQNVQEVSIRFLQDINSWIFLPQLVVFSVAGHDRQFKEVKQMGHQIRLAEGKKVIKSFSYKRNGPLVRYVKIRAKNIGICPQWHPGAGGLAFLMTDEIIVK